MKSYFETLTELSNYLLESGFIVMNPDGREFVNGSISAHVQADIDPFFGDIDGYIVIYTYQ